MDYTIGFSADTQPKEDEYQTIENETLATYVRKSLVSVYFKDRNMTLAYYNDMFDLKVGDIVYVDGKLEGLRGTVVSVNYAFKIKLSDYKRVISAVTTDIHGEVTFHNSHVYAFDRNTMPYDRVKRWFLCPSDDDEFETGTDDETSFSIDNLSEMKIEPNKAEKGHEYYSDNNVVYISVDNGHGRAIVEGRKYYEVEFDYNKRRVSNLVCSCFCGEYCKHEFAVMLQLKECLDNLMDDKKKSSKYFAALSKDAFMGIVLGRKNKGKITLD